MPYKGAGPAVADVVAGHVQLSFVSVPAVIGFVRQGRLRMLGQCGATRFQSLPEVPTLIEAGVPDFTVSSGFHLAGPAGIPRPIAEKLNAALIGALRDPVNRKTLIERGADPIGNTIDEHGAYITSEITKWKRVVKVAGIKAEL